MKRLVWLVLILPVLPIASSAQTTECDGNFHIVHRLPEVGLYDLDFATPNEGWAVGFDYENDEPDERAWVVHFDDKSFEPMTPPHEPGTELSGVDAIAPNDVYAVGYRYQRRRRSETVAMHWDGAAWTQMDVPSPGVRTQLVDLVAVAPDDIWTVGWLSRRGQYGSETLVIHYDGSTWSRVPAPSPGQFPQLFAIDATAADDIWAVGRGGRDRPLALHWNGMEWRRRGLGLEFRRYEQLQAIDAVTEHDIWAVGVGRRRDLILHFDGSAWSNNDFPDSRGSESFTGVGATSSEAWIVGHRFVLRPYETVIPLAGRFSDGSWTQVSFEGDRYGDIYAVALDGAGNAWAIGATFDPEGPDVGDVIEKACAP